MIYIKTAAIICEYNPFHNGHKYHIEMTREKLGATHIVCIMSGNFTQRGDVAVIDKYARAKMALCGGADLVIELPCAYSLASAEYFARGACHIIDSLGCVDFLSFGSECGDAELIKEAAGAVDFCMESDDFLYYMKNGYSYPAALKKTMQEYYTDDVVELLDSPNNTLAIEYIRALDRKGSSIDAVSITRDGAPHDSDQLHQSRISASKIREMIKQGEDISAYVPYEMPENTADIMRLETAILAKLRCMTTDQLKRLPNSSNGMENRIYAAIRKAPDLETLYSLIKSKNFTMARIRRMILCAFLEITKNDLKKLPAYVRILGMNDRGKEILANTKNCKLPIDTSLAALAKTGDIASHQADIEERAGNLYALAFATPKECGTEYTAKPIII